MSAHTNEYTHAYMYTGTHTHTYININSYIKRFGCHAAGPALDRPRLQTPDGSSSRVAFLPYSKQTKPSKYLHNMPGDDDDGDDKEQEEEEEEIPLFPTNHR